jgi:hypothetical protein
VSFSVDAAGLVGLPQQLDRMQVDALRGSAYVDAHARISSGGVLTGLAADHQRIVHDVRGYLDKLGSRVAGNAADAVRAASAYYEATDAQAAARLDASYPAVTGEHAGGAGSYGATSYSSSAVGARFRDVASPATHYVAPPDRHSEYQDEPQPLQVIGVGGAARALIIKATELAAVLGLGHRWDPYEAVLKPVTGDWNGLRASADVFANVSAALGDVSMNLHATAYDVPEVWTGNAADGVTGYLLRVADQVDSAKQSVTGLSGGYEAAAEHAFERFRQAGDHLDELVDLVVLFIAEAVVAETTVETGVGPLIAGAAAAATAVEMYKIIHAVEAVVGAVEAELDGLRTLLRGFGGGELQLKLPALDPAHLQLPGDQSGVGKVMIGPPR